MVSSSVLAALIQMLFAKGALSLEEVQEVYETALFILEKQQAGAKPEMAKVFNAARLVIEEMVRREPSSI